MYKITIERTRVEKVTKGRQWEKQFDRIEGDPKENYGYAPVIESTESVTGVVFEQQFDKIDLNKVAVWLNMHESEEVER